jgi:hypothetical protein
LTFIVKFAYNKIPEKGQTRRKAGTESYGSYQDGRAAWDQGSAAFYFFTTFTRRKIIMRRKAGLRGRTFMVVVSLLLVACLAGPAGANIVVDEHGNGFYDGTPLTFGQGQDPVTGGLPNALFYLLPGAVTSGDVVLTEPPTGAESDLIRFYSNFFVGNYLIFYSDYSDPPDALADIGFPVGLQANNITLEEQGDEGYNGYVYTPSQGQPGYVVGAVVTYQFVSDGVVPVPPSAWLLGSGLLGLLGFGWRSRQG